MNIDDIRFKKVMEMSGVKEGDSVLDVGCGDKKLETYLDKSISYIGIDKGDYDLEKVQPKFKQRFDVIFMLWFLEEVENYKTILKWARALLKPNGRIVVLTPSHNRIITNSEWEHTTHCFRPTNIDNLAKKVGMTVEKKSGVYIYIPILNISFPSSQMFYNNAFIFVLEKSAK